MTNMIKMSTTKGSINLLPDSKKPASKQSNASWLLGCTMLGFTPLVFTMLLVAMLASTPVALASDIKEAIKARGLDKSELITAINRQVVYTPYLESDVNCAGLDNYSHEEMTELFSWRIFSKLNVPMYFDSISNIDNTWFWGRRATWEVQSNNSAPFWGQLLNHAEIDQAQHPYIRQDNQWQCDESCLTSRPVGSPKGVDDAVLLDSSGNAIRFETRFNQAWFYSTEKFYQPDYENFIVNNQGNLFNMGICGADNHQLSNNNEFKMPTVILKLAWKQLTADEDERRYISMRTTTNAGDEAVYGVVAAHIMVKTRKEWAWVWSTFEHENNFEGYQHKDKNIPANFNVGQSTCVDSYEKDCKPFLTPYEEVTQSTKFINSVTKKGFSRQSSPLQHYRLLGVQFALKDLVESNGYNDGIDNALEQCKQDTKNGTQADYYVSDDNDYLIFAAGCKGIFKRVQKIANKTLYNPVLEPFSTNRQTDKSCIGCHLKAKVNFIGNGSNLNHGDKSIEIFTDFNFSSSIYGIPQLKDQPYPLQRTTTTNQK